MFDHVKNLVEEAETEVQAELCTPEITPTEEFIEIPEEIVEIEIDEKSIEIIGDEKTTPTHCPVCNRTKDIKITYGAWSCNACGYFFYRTIDLFKNTLVYKCIKNRNCIDDTRQFWGFNSTQ